MNLHAGDVAAKEGFFDCERCRHTVFLFKGQTVEACSQCGGTRFGERLLNLSREWQKEDINSHQ